MTEHVKIGGGDLTVRGGGGYAESERGGIKGGRRRVEGVRPHPMQRRRRRRNWQRTRARHVKHTRSWKS